MTKLYIDSEANDHPVNEHARLSGHKQAVISLSGGMDSSTVLLRLLTEGYQVTAICFDYGQKHNIELTRAGELVEYLNQNGYKGRIRTSSRINPIFKGKWAFSKISKNYFKRIS